MNRAKQERSDEAGRATDTTTNRRFAPLRRWLAASVPAAGVTGGLFMAMTFVVSVEAPPAEALEFRPLPKITPQLLEDFEPRDYEPARQIEAAELPPSPPPVLADARMGGVPAVVLTGHAPEVPKSGPLGPILAPGIQYSRVLQPLSEPVVAYPDALARRGVEGECEVRFSVNMRGQPFDVSATCSDPGFVRAAERAVARSEFAPQIVQGQPVERHGVVYPITFQLSE